MHTNSPKIIAQLENEIAHRYSTVRRICQPIYELQLITFT